MSKKSSKKKSSSGGNTGTQLGALALIISLVALGLSAYQFVTTPVSEGPEFYIVEHDDIIYLDKYSYSDYLNELSITYTTEIGDIVVLEFSCRLYMPASTSTTFTINFDNNETLFPPSRIYVFEDSPTMTSGYMRYTFEATATGENDLVVYTTCSEEIDNWIDDCLLTVTVYG